MERRALLLLFALSACHSPHNGPTPPAPGIVDGLVARLSDEDPSVRDDAEYRLVELGEGVLSLLEAGRRDAEPEAVGRIERVIDRLRWWEYTFWMGKRAIDLRIGRLLWSVPTNEPLRSIESVRLDRTVVLQAQQGTLECRSLRDGAVLWTQGPFSPEDRAHLDPDTRPSLFLVGGMIVRIAPALMRAYDPTTGRVLWTTRFEEHGYPLWNLKEAREGFMLDDHTCYDKSDGRMRWTTRGRFASRVSEATILPDGDVVVAFETSVARLSGARGEAMWRFQRPPGWHGKKALSVGAWFVTGSSDVAECRDSSTGQVLWSAKGSGPATAAVGPDGSPVLVATASFLGGGELVALDPATWGVTWRRPLKRDGVHLRIEQGRLFLTEFETRTCVTTLQCLDLRTGDNLWVAEASGILADHSIYGQSAWTEVRGDWVILASAQSAGDFVEVFRKDDGSTLSKWSSQP